VIKRIIEISQARTYLSVKLGQLVVNQEGVDKSIPCEDIGVVILNHPAITITNPALNTLLENGAVVLTCDRENMPSGIFMPLDSSHNMTEEVRYQVNAKEPLNNRLWKQIVKSKISHQAKVLSGNERAYGALKELGKQVKSGDRTNIEARAAKVYWKYFLGDEPFKRRRDGDSPNELLNYGYMIIRAAVARAICSAGLLSCVGIHHRNKYNGFCLADDLLEPFRGFAEQIVLDIWNDSSLKEQGLSQQVRAKLLSVLFERIIVGDFTGPLLVALHRTCASLKRCYRGEHDKLLLPKL